MTRLRRQAARLARGHTRIAARLLLFNLLLVFTPVVGTVYLGVYEDHLLAQQERAMTDAGRLLSVALDSATLETESQDVLTRLAGTTDARFRVVTPDGRVIADSARKPGSSEIVPSPYGDETSAFRSTWLYRVGSWLGLPLRTLGRQATEIASVESMDREPGRVAAPEIARAVASGYGAATRLSAGGARSVTLFVAVPIRAADSVPAVVLVSQSTNRILARLYELRLRIFQVVVASIVVAVIVTAIASLTIVRPVRQLRDDANVVATHRGDRARGFRGTHRRDEIGELARSVAGLTGRLEGHVRSSERFAADVAHELRNPLASIRASAEMLAASDTPEDRERFRTRIERDIGRLELLLVGLRDATTVDAQLEEEARSRVDLRDVAAEIAAEYGGQVLAGAMEEGVVVSAAHDRIAQVLRNLLDNARSFSPADRPVDLTISRRGREAVLLVRDRGPGIAPEHLTRVFDRFFTHRPDQPDARQVHTGLGLAIAQTIVLSYGGTMVARNHPEGGAEIEVVLPIET